MTSKQFEKIMEDQFSTCRSMLIRKATEYADDDERLHNFKSAAGLIGTDPKDALSGMMLKHTVSVYDMCRDGKYHSEELWEEKITDHINYLLLLKALVYEDHNVNEGDK